MRKAIIAVFLSLGMTGVLGALGYVAYAQINSQVEDKGYIEIGSYTETATKQRPLGSLYQGSGILTYVGKPPKPYIQHDMGGYELDPAPAADRNKPYDRRDLHGPWESLFNAPGRGYPPMTDLGRQIRATRITSNEVFPLNKPTNDPELNCDPLGFPAGFGKNTRPLEWIQIPKFYLIHFGWHETWVKIWMDGRLLPKQPIDPSWVGYSVGKWVGNTLVVDTNGVDERVWQPGPAMGATFDATWQTRWRRIDHNTMQLNYTHNDPAVYGKVYDSPDHLYQLYPNLEIDILPCAVSEYLEYKLNTPTETPDAGRSTGNQSFVPPNAR
jgi:hypothetical protein